MPAFRYVDERGVFINWLARRCPSGRYRRTRRTARLGDYRGWSTIERRRSNPSGRFPPPQPFRLAMRLLALNRWDRTRSAYACVRFYKIRRRLSGSFTHAHVCGLALRQIHWCSPACGPSARHNLPFCVRITPPPIGETAAISCTVKLASTRHIPPRKKCQHQIGSIAHPMIDHPDTQQRIKTFPWTTAITRRSIRIIIRLIPAFSSAFTAANG